MLVELREYERRELPISTETARRLLDVSGGRVGVTPANDGFLVTAQQHVGTIVLPELKLLIRPKVPMENVFLMLGAGIPIGAWRSERFGFGTAPDLLPAFAAFFARTCEQVLAGGLVRSYRAEHERVSAVRGRIDLVGALRRPGMQIPVACTYDEFTDDVIENRVVKAAITRLLRVGGVDFQVRRTLRRELARFDSVGEPPDVLGADRLRFTRLNRHYEPLVRLALLVLRNLTLRDQAGEAEASGFLLDMNDLFQTFVSVSLRTALAGRLAVDTEPTVYLDLSRQVATAPDLVLRGPEGIVFVGDAKYKITYTGRGHSDDYYQLLAYTTALGLPEGVLVYCTCDGPIPPTVVRVRHTHQRLYTWPLRLQGSRAMVEGSVKALAAWLIERAG